MSIVAYKNAPEALESLSQEQRFRFYGLHDETGAYAVAALAEHADCLELHLEVLRFGAGVVRALRQDVQELKEMARALGKRRIVGMKIEEGRADPRWPKFTRLFGFTGQKVYQSAELAVGE